MKSWDELDIIPIWNVPYKPEFQPIEMCFSQVKHIYRKNKLNAFMNAKTFSYKEEIARAFESLKTQTII